MAHKNKDDFNPEFDGQRRDENLILVFRRHAIGLRKGFYMILIPLLIGAVPVFIWQDTLWLLYLPLGGLAIGLVLFFYQWVGWYFTIFILTDQRIRQVTQKGFFGKDVIDLDVANIQNVSYKVPGFTGEVLGFGTIVVQTIVGDLIMDKIHHPNKIYNVLQDTIRGARPVQAAQQA